MFLGWKDFQICQSICKAFTVQSYCCVFNFEATRKIDEIIKPWYSDAAKVNKERDTPNRQPIWNGSSLLRASIASNKKYLIIFHMLNSSRYSSSQLHSQEIDYYFIEDYNKIFINPFSLSFQPFLPILFCLSLALSPVLYVCLSMFLSVSLSICLPLS